jgi:hypothetical protein
MATQLGLIKMKGTLDNLTYMQTMDGYIVKRKTSISRNRLKYSEAYAPTRMENNEFKVAARASKLLRQSILTLWENENFGRIQSRLTKLFRRILDTDNVNERGYHKISNGETGFLNGFEFNSASELKQVIHAAWQTEINRTAGEINIRIPSFVPIVKVSAVPYATHFQLFSSGVEIDFEKDSYRSDFSDSPILPLNNEEIEPILLKNIVGAGTENILLALLGIRFYQAVNGNYYLIRNKKFSSLTITGAYKNS